MRDHSPQPSRSYVTKFKAVDSYTCRTRVGLRPIDYRHEYFDDYVCGEGMDVEAIPRLTC
jgi:hypothetical protein